MSSSDQEKASSLPPGRKGVCKHLEEMTDEQQATEQWNFSLHPTANFYTLSVDTITVIFP